MKLKYLFLGVFLSGSLTWGAALPSSENFTVLPYMQKSTSERPVLHLIIRDAQPHSGVCDYTIAKFQYFQAHQALEINLDRGPCLNDAYGKSQGDFFWRLPNELQSPGVSICVFINKDAPTTLVYDEIRGAFEVRASAKGESDCTLGAEIF